MRFLIALFAAAGLFAAGLFAAAPAAAQSLSPDQEKAVEQMIGDYFIKNPQKMEAVLDNLQLYMAAQEELAFQRALAAREKDLYRNMDDFSMGPKDAPITIVEFFDYNCGYCKRAFAPLMQVLRENSDVRLVFKELPILNDDSRTAARIALSIGDQLQFLTFHTKLMTHRGPVNAATIDKTLAEMQLTREAFDNPGLKRRAAEILAKNDSLARELKINGTPAFLINGKLYPGALDAEGLQDALASARAALKN